MISYARLGGLGPADNETLDVHEPTGEFQAWRSHAPVAGRFRGRLDEADREALAASAASALAAGVPQATLRPDASREVVRLGGLRVVVETGVRPAGPWGELLDLLHRLLISKAAAAPRAAVTLETEGPASRGVVRLAHRGTHPLDLDLGGLAVRAEVLGPDHGMVGGRELALPPAGAGRLTATPGWSLPLELTAGPDLPPGGRLVVQASLVAYDSLSPTPVRVVVVEPAPPR
jgi:hypothetical protein